MKTIRAVYEKGVFRPLDDVELPERTKVEFEPKVIRSEQESQKAMKKIYELLSESCETGDPFLAARHNEHQP
jgi:predicted DNA-binding antitoxin AbrB/MazE fold protein